MGRTSCEYNWMNTGKQCFYDNSTYETLLAMYPGSFGDDFAGADLVISNIAIAAQGTITMAGVAIANETFVIDTQTFTWKAARAIAGEVTIGANAAAAVTNIVTAVTADLASVTAVDGAGDTVVITVVLRGSAGNSLVFTEASSNMTVDGAGTLGATTSGTDVESGCKWAKKLVGAAPPTVAKSADVVNAHVLCSLTADAQKQDAALHWDDQLALSIAQGAIFETRLSLTTLPTLLGVASFGLWGAWADGGSAYRVGFEVPAGGIVTCESDDAATDTAAATTTTLVAGTYNIFRIDCTTQTDIKFFIDGARVAASTTFTNVASAANAKSQPHLGLYKASGAGLGVMSVDYVRCWQNRS